jgi:hypothetical protein
MKDAKVLFNFKEINRTKQLVLRRKELEAIMNALEDYRLKHPFKQEYKLYLDELRSSFLMLGEW